jgi:very-short-patch-repair endonuclease
MRKVEHSEMNSQPQGCLGFLFRLFGGGGLTSIEASGLPKVQVNKYFVSNAEADFFRVLRKVVGDQGHVLAQVSLRQLLWFPGNNQSNPGRQTWQNKVAAKTVDFVVCDVATLKPLVVIELDEPSHSRADRQTRDEQVDSILDAAGMPVIRVLTSRAYNTRELADALSSYLERIR